MKAVDFMTTCPDGTILATHRRVNPRDGPIRFAVVGKRIDEGDGALFRVLDWSNHIVDAEYKFNARRTQQFYDAVMDPTAKGNKKKNHIRYRLTNPRQVFRDVHLLEADKPPTGTVVVNGKLVVVSTIR